MMSGSAKRGGKRTRAVRATGTPNAPTSQSGASLSSTATAPRYAAINGLITVRDRQKLQFLSRRTRVPQSEYLREAVRDLLAKYRDVFDDSPFEDDEPL